MASWRSLLLLSVLLPSSVLGRSIVQRTSKTSTAACNQLSTTFRSFVVDPSDGADYETRRTGNWAQTAWASPSCIFAANTTADLAAALAIVVSQKSNFAVRSGGHQVAPLFANTNDGVLFDMSGFDEVEYDATKGVAVVGTGLRWGDVYEQLEPFGMTVIGGRVLNVGVGGLILGSGLSYLSNLYGMACDNVVNFEVVLASGKVVNANMENNSDLFWALKGGSNNIGIVTRFTLTAHPLGQVFGGIIGYSNDQIPDVLDAYSKYQAVANDNPDSNLMLQLVISNATTGSLVNLFYAEPVERPDIFAPFYNIPSLFDTTGVKSLVEFLEGATQTEIPRWDFRTIAYAADSEMDSAAIDSAWKQLPTITGLESGTLVLAYQPITPALVNEGIKRGGNALGLIAESQTWFATNTGWWSPEDDETAYGVPEKIMAGIEARAEANGAPDLYLFANDASRDQKVMEHYGSANLQSLRDVATKYDPDRVFQVLCPGGFKLW